MPRCDFGMWFDQRRGHGAAEDTEGGLGQPGRRKCGLGNRVITLEDPKTADVANMRCQMRSLQLRQTSPSGDSTAEGVSTTSGAGQHAVTLFWQESIHGRNHGDGRTESANRTEEQRGTGRELKA
ncbi:uncharacterized protein LOC119590016 isoform X2 [Penaeus monodon]|uniref:uncharacterized protein LOC119590016 isoform X2 n=1 Tax=Penaeus monodon TaxID=6687 RepID=UPI0018A727BE|nr:uncharacterized protein LOC119590016 isoform X2 [Penaeus monodon]